MRRRAVWQSVPGDPRTRWGWFLRDARRWGALFLRKALLGIAALAVYAAFSGLTFAFLALAAAFAALVAVAPDRPRSERSSEAGSPFKGRVEVRRRGALLGEDEVSVTFDDGWMRVEGARTAFALGSDLVVGESNANGVALDDGTELRFRLQPGRPIREGAGFQTALARWRDGGRPYDGEPVLPPDQPHPSAGVRAGTELAIATLGTFAGFCVVVAFGFWWGLLALLLVPGPSFTEAVAGVVRLRRVAGQR